MIVAGEVIARKDGRDYFLAVGEGFVQIMPDRVAIMTDMAIRAENIDEAKAEEARKRAEARLAEKLDDEEAAMTAAALAHSLAQLKVKLGHAALHQLLDRVAAHQRVWTFEQHLVGTAHRIHWDIPCHRHLDGARRHEPPLGR